MVSVIPVDQRIAVDDIGFVGKQRERFVGIAVRVKGVDLTVRIKLSEPLHLFGMITIQTVILACIDIDLSSDHGDVQLFFKRF